MNKNTIIISEQDGLQAEMKLAAIVASLVREGVVFEAEEYFGGYRIKLTGGF